MKRFGIILLVVVIFGVVPAFAQNATPTEVPPICTEFIGQPDNVRTSYYMGEGQGFFAAGQFSRAINSYTCITYEIDSNYVPAYMGRAAVWAQRRDFPRALEDYNRALQLQPNLLAAHNNRGVVYTSTGEYALALTDFNNALDLDGDSLIALNNRAIVYALQRNYEASIEDLETAVAVAGTDSIIAQLRDPDRATDLPPVDYSQSAAQPYALLGIIYSAYALENYQNYLLLTGSSGDFRVQGAAGALESRFTFDLRLDDGTWLLLADFSPEG